MIGNWYGGEGLFGSGATVSNLGVREIHDDERVNYRCTSPLHFAPSTPASDCGYMHYWSFHPGGANFAFCDGSVRFIRYEADQIVPALATRNGGEVVEASID
jgi:prepilin-type processing-associated H-X9-DG protein